MDLHIALLRGVNVGSKNRLPMADLTAMVRSAGAQEVTTYIQSGNVLFRADEALARELPSLLAREFEARFGWSVPVIVRSAPHLAQIVMANPFLDEGLDEGDLHVAFLADRPTCTRVDELDPDRSPPDRFQVVGSEIYVWTPNGQANTKLTTTYFESKLKTVCTVRNWRTTLKLVELATG